MSKKKAPQEKKEAAYERDHYAFPWVSPQGFRKTWKKKKNYRNRVVRRKSKNLLHSVENYSFDDLGPEHESLTSELFRKGLTKKTLRKVGVVPLREKVRRKTSIRENRGKSQREWKDRWAVMYTERIVALERDPLGEEARQLLVALRFNDTTLRNFLNEHPEWNKRLWTKIKDLQKQARQSEREALLKKKQKRKWRSPTLRLPKSARDNSTPD